MKTDLFEATKGKLWRTDREREEKIERLVASAEEMNSFREELIDLGVDETHVDEAREYFRSVDSPLIWYCRRRRKVEARADERCWRDGGGEEERRGSC